MTCNTQFEGVFCPSITITNADGTIDYDNWGKHLEHLIDAGIDGVLLFGSIGEFYAIDVKTKAEAVRFAVSKVAGRMKVLVGVGDTNLDNVRTLAAESEAAGADALVAVSSYYFGPSPDCAKRYFSAVAKQRRCRSSCTTFQPGRATTSHPSWWRISQRRTRTSSASKTLSTPSATPGRSLLPFVR